MFTNKSIFKSPALEKQYLAVYESVLAMWPVTHEPLDVPTHFGVTHVNTCGQKDLPPMVLLPGFGVNSTQWFPNAAALSSQFRVYALDIIGQPGKSPPSEGITPTNYGDWIAEVDEKLRQVQTPILLLIGGRSVIYNPERVYHPAAVLIPGIQAEIIPSASHGLNAVASKLVNARTL
jgi:pimeloyl-ACP methyl ester carboxylesterase